ncbi:acyl-CoA synthetase family member 4 homolog [Aedes aegypti]|uniref:Uncharacterized protein n=1 Tax=Aedes aegypti TaxID=7159 RepID=A0A6I8TN24_AEDAE|nr:acyl-CoA synthetase family member 4 homolog [Aedes aegypti]
MLKPEVFSKFHLKNAVKYIRDENKVCAYSYGQLWSAMSIVQEAIARSQLEKHYIGVALIHSPSLIAVISGIHQSSAAFCNLKFQRSKVEAFVTILKSIPANYCFFYKNDTEHFTGNSGIQIKFKIVAELNLLEELIVLVQFEFDIKHSTSFTPDIAYCVATSGSTGAPKLVRVPTQCILPNLITLEKLLELHETDQILVSCPPTFDPFVVDMFLALRNAACLVLVGNELRLDAGRLQRVVFEQTEVTVMQMTPSFLRQWNDNEIRDVLLGRSSSLRHLILGGEPFPSWLKIPAHSPVKVYNIYGITEVSCWASIERVTASSNINPSLGSPLDDSIVFQLRDVNTGHALNLENVVDPIRGNLHIGSGVRKCIIGEESSEDVLRIDAIVYRSTGDLVEQRSDGKFYYLGRCDESVKRLGVRVNLSWLEQCADQCEGILKSCAIFDPRRHRIALCYTSSGIVQKNDIRTFMESKLKSEEMPNDFLQVKELPLSDHGKINRKKILEQFLEDNDSKPTKNLKEQFLRNVFELLGVHLQARSTSYSKRVKYDLGCSFLDVGGTSVQALQISASLQDYTKTRISSLIGMLLDKSVPLKDVLQYLEGVRHETPSSSSLQSVSSEENTLLKMKITVQSHFDMDKCIDASPTEYRSEKHKRGIVAVGSHSHKLLVLNTETDQIITQLVLPDRIESAVSYIADEERGLIGCYDGSLYCFDLWTGAIRWSFDSGGMIKCKALVLESAVIFGSYAEEHNLFALDLNGILIWRSKLGTKGILSSPLSTDHERAFVATLDGLYCCFNTRTGAVVWEDKLQTPVFANTTLVSGHNAVLVAEVKGILHCLASKSGSKLWQIRTEGNLFSSPQVTPCDSNQTVEILFGCHDKHLYCYDWTDAPAWEPLHERIAILRNPSQRRRTMKAKGVIHRTAANRPASKSITQRRTTASMQFIFHSARVCSAAKQHLADGIGSTLPRRHQDGKQTISVK